jgi:hypothetical protein
MARGLQTNSDRNPLCEVIAVASVASESQIFPPARPLPGPRGLGAQDQHAAGAEPGGFAKLLDSKPADDREAPARSKRDRSEDMTARGSRRSNDAAHVKRAKDKAPAKDETSEPTEATTEAKADETSQDTQQTSNDKPTDASPETANTESHDATAEADVATDTATDSAILTIAAADAIVPAVTADVPAAVTPTVAVVTIVLPETASPIAQAAVPAEIAPAAGASAAPAAPAAQPLAAPATAAGDSAETAAPKQHIAITVPIMADTAVAMGDELIREQTPIIGKANKVMTALPKNHFIFSQSIVLKLAS